MINDSLKKVKRKLKAVLEINENENTMDQVCEIQNSQY